MIERDYRLTGVFRGQTDRPQAPRGFEGKEEIVQENVFADRCCSQQSMEGTEIQTPAIQEPADQDTQMEDKIL